MCALLALVIAPVAVGIAWYVQPRSGAVGILAAAIAALVCWGAASLALVATYIGQKSGWGVQGILVATIFRMGLPLALGVVLQQQGGPLAEAGIFSMILGLYLCSLVVETILSLKLIAPTGPKLRGAA